MAVSSETICGKPTLQQRPSRRALSSARRLFSLPLFVPVSLPNPHDRYRLSEGFGNSCTDCSYVSKRRLPSPSSANNRRYNYPACHRQLTAADRLSIALRADSWHASCGCLVAVVDARDVPHEVAVVGQAAFSTADSTWSVERGIATEGKQIPCAPLPRRSCGSRGIVPPRVVRRRSGATNTAAAPILVQICASSFFLSRW